MDFGKIINKAWGIFTKFKILWVFGILASCVGPVAPVAPVGPYYPGGFPNFDEVTGEPMMPEEMEKFFKKFEETFEQNPEEIEKFFEENIGEIVGMFATFFFIALAVGIVMQLIFFVIRSFGRVGIIQGVMRAEAQAETMTFGDLFGATMPYMWRVLGLNFLVWFVLIVAFYGSFFGLIIGAVATGGLLVLCIVPLFCVFFISMFFVYGLLEMANSALVVEDLGIIDAWQKGWIAFRKNLGNITVLMLFVIVLSIVMIIVMMIPSGIVSSMILSGFQSGNDVGVFEMMQKTWWIGYVTMPIYLLGIGLARLYTGSLWTLAYMEFSKTMDLDTLIELESAEQEDEPKDEEGVVKEE